eukprot:COSAG02_NODE_43187_length_377_cov_0.820144_1_plen_24_part_10
MRASRKRGEGQAAQTDEAFTSVEV